MNIAEHVTVFGLVVFAIILLLITITQGKTIDVLSKRISDLERTVYHRGGPDHH